MAKKSTTEHRKIPLKEDFMMTKTISARIYGYLQCKILFNRRQEKICVNDRLHTNHYSTRDVREEWEYESTINLIRNYQKRHFTF